jgi:hypothetical protein
VAANAAEKGRAGAIPYRQQDCQAFVEGCVGDCGGAMAYRGSNDMFRNACTWLGTLAEAKALGKMVPGALLFIHSRDGGEPAQYRADGLGNASHVGLYCGLADVEVAHSSASRGRVAASTLKNGWTHAGWAKEIDYGSGGERMTTAGGMESVAAARATVAAANGEPVKLRKLPGKHSETLMKVPVGTEVQVLEAGSEWCTVVAQGKRGYMMREFLEMGDLLPSESTLEERVAALEARMLALEAGVPG